VLIVAKLRYSIQEATVMLGMMLVLLLIVVLILFFNTAEDETERRRSERQKTSARARSPQVRQVDSS